MSDQDSNSKHSVASQQEFVERLLTKFEAYAGRYPEELAEIERFRELLAEEPRCFERDCWRGHITGSAWLVNGAGTHTLLTHHRKLKMWLQLGGHSDGDPDTAAVALREAREESGLTVRLLSDALFDVDVHPIPARKNDPEHHHYDVRFIMQVVGPEDFVVSQESLDLAWVPINSLTDYIREGTILRMRDKYLQHFDPLP